MHCFYNYFALWHKQKRQKNGVWKYYNEQGKVITTECWKYGKNETEKFNAIKKVAAKHIGDKEPTNKIEKVTKKSVKVLEIALETAKSKIQKH